MKLEIVSGSPRSKSVTQRMALHLHRLFSEKAGIEAGLIDLRHHHLPPMEDVFTTPEAAPEAHRKVAQRIFAADGFVFVSPEYNGNFPPALQNLFDHFPKQTHKPFGIATATTGALGGMRAALHLQHLVLALFGVASPHMLITPQVDKKFDAEGNLLDASFQKSIDTFVNEYLWLAQKLTA